MKRIVLLLLLNLMSLFGFAQKSGPVSWQIDTVKIAPLTYELRMKATVKEPWHIYTQKASNAGLAMPTQIIFDPNSIIELIGTTTEKGEEQQDVKNVSHYSKGVTFTQILKLRSKEKTTLNFTIKYMACTKSMCLPPSSVQFTVTINNDEKL